MSRPVRKLVDTGKPGWDAEVDDNLSALYDAPFPIFLYTGTPAQLDSAYPPGTYDYCLVVLDDTIAGEASVYFSKGGVWEELQYQAGHGHAQYALVSHNHSASAITSGTLNVADAIEWDGAKKTVTFSPPSGGADGDIHFELE